MTRPHLSVSRSTVLIATLVSIVLACLLVPAPSAPASPQDARSTYRNPLAPQIPDDGTVDSCADPTVLRGQQPGDRHWYLYCTTDPLNDEDVDANGAPVFHPIPTMRLRRPRALDLRGRRAPRAAVVGGRGAALWAPDVVYSKTTGRYYLTFVVTDTDDSLRGPGRRLHRRQRHRGGGQRQPDRARGTSATQPLVGPAGRPRSSCAFFWTFDPDVLGDAVGASSVLYFGSYYGGIHATQVDSHRGRGDHVRGDHADRHRQPLRGQQRRQARRPLLTFRVRNQLLQRPVDVYGVFAAGPHLAGTVRGPRGTVDPAGRVGGSPVLLPERQPLGGRRPQLGLPGRGRTLVDGLPRRRPQRPVLRLRRPASPSGRSSSTGSPGCTAGPRCAPATGRPTQAVPVAASPTGAAANAERIPPVRPTPDGRYRRRSSDDFEDGLDPAWPWVREPDPATYAVEDGCPALGHPGRRSRPRGDTASVLTRPAPAGSFVVQTRVELNLPPEGCCQNYVQAGLVNYADDDRYLKLAHVSIWETRQSEWAKEVPPGEPEFPRYGNGVVGAARRHHLAAGGASSAGPARTSTPPTPAGTATTGCAAAPGPTTSGVGEKIGLVSMGGPGLRRPVRRRPGLDAAVTS